MPKGKEPSKGDAKKQIDPQRLRLLVSKLGLQFDELLGDLPILQRIARCIAELIEEAELPDEEIDPQKIELLNEQLVELFDALLEDRSIMARITHYVALLAEMLNAGGDEEE